MVYYIDEVNLRALENIKFRIKKVELNNNQIIFKMQRRDVTGIFSAFKQIPEAETVKIKDTYQEEEPDQSDLTYFERLVNMAYGDFLPLLIAMVTLGGIIGLINYIGIIFH